MRLEDILDQLACTQCGADLRVAGGTLVCSTCGHEYPVVDGVAVFHAADPESAEHRATGFYEDSQYYFQRLVEKRVQEFQAPHLGSMLLPDRGLALDCGSGAGNLVVQNAKRGLKAIGIEVSVRGALFSAYSWREMSATCPSRPVS